MNSTKKIIFDADIIRSFGVIGELDLLIDLYKDRIVVPSVVKDELEVLKNGRYKNIYTSFNTLVKNGKIEIFEIMYGTEEFDLYIKLSDDNGTYKIGEGEAAVLAIAMNNEKYISSSNLRDIQRFVDNKLVLNKPTLDILCDVYISKKRNLSEIEYIKKQMILKGRILPPESMKDLFIDRNLLREEDK
ncbi:hypothetical protein [uncultured Ilyobacter sp.]|uniref:hypothetical protein n=1 Tax=uncultured Ilyobacter sp. TaxID=544433 RepID=UPI0029C09E60|nr:hypothetical protein [uncultured Ilyobacter sp.]